MPKVQKELDITKVEIDGSTFSLLNPDKAQKAVDFMEEKEMEMTGEVLLAMYDRLGGAIRLETELGQRALALGTFYDFEARKAKKVDFANLGEDAFSDEVKVVRKVAKKAPKKVSVADRLDKKADAKPPKSKKSKEEEAEDTE